LRVFFQPVDIGNYRVTIITNRLLSPGHWRFTEYLLYNSIGFPVESLSPVTIFANRPAVGLQILWFHKCGRKQDIAWLASKPELATRAFIQRRFYITQDEMCTKLGIMFKRFSDNKLRFS